MAKSETLYLFTPGERGIFAEVYFPKKVVFQGRIFDSLEKGHNESRVKKYLRDNIEDLLVELARYHNLFNPYQDIPVKNPGTLELTVDQALKRIDMYRSPFRGWSMYEVDGMFFNKKGKIYEERTQVIRLMFRLRSTHTARARKMDALDVLRSILFFAISTRGMLAEEEVWDEASKRKFLSAHEPWADPNKKEFAERHFAKVVREAAKWVDDCALFIFSYLVREFSQRVLQLARLEEEIWVTSFFDMTLNTVKKSSQQTRERRWT